MDNGGTSADAWPHLSPLRVWLVQMETAREDLVLRDGGRRIITVLGSAWDYMNDPV